MPVAQIDSLSLAHRIRTYQMQGFWLATIDSVCTDTAGCQVRIAKGPPIRVRKVFVDAPVEQKASTSSLVDSLFNRGQVLDSLHFYQGIQQVLDFYEAIGYPLAQVHLQLIQLDPTSGDATLYVTVEPGEQVPFFALKLPGATRTAPDFIAKLLGWKRGEILSAFHPEQIRAQLLRLGLFKAVGVPQLEVYEGLGAVIKIPVQEDSPGIFDLLVGYQPGQGARKGTWVGEGRLQVHNAWGRGIRGEVEFARRPGLISRMNIAVRYPYVAGWPVNIEGRFSGYQQDSTYGRQEFLLRGEWQRSGQLALFFSLRTKRVLPGAGGQEALQRSVGWGWGGGLRWNTLNHRSNPSRGWWLELLLEEGRKYLAESRTRIAQQRVEGNLRTYLEWKQRQVIVLGLDGRWLRADVYDLSDLFFFGGANSLRGYEEQQFLGTLTLRLLMEYRVLLDGHSHAFVFGDMGYLEKPTLAGNSSARRWLPGYGLGIQYDTPLGLMRVSYALNPEETLTAGKLHIGMAFSL